MAEGHCVHTAQNVNILQEDNVNICIQHEGRKGLNTGPHLS